MNIRYEFLNFLKTPDSWGFTGKYDFPVIDGYRVQNSFVPDYVEFNEAYRVPKEQRKDKIVQFFIRDYLFERVWTKPNQTAKFLSGFKAVLMPDFSRYTDMPLAMQIWNCYRKMWVSRYWYDYGIKVIPTAGWSDERSYDFCFDGMPKHSTVAVSSLGTQSDTEAKKLFYLGYNRMLEVLEPYNILFYGKIPEWLDKNTIIHTPHSRDVRFKAMREAKKLKEVSIHKINKKDKNLLENK